MSIVWRLVALTATYGVTLSLAVAIAAIFWGIPSLALPAAGVAVAIEIGRDYLDRTPAARLIPGSEDTR